MSSPIFEYPKNPPSPLDPQPMQAPTQHTLKRSSGLSFNAENRAIGISFCMIFNINVDLNVHVISHSTIRPIIGMCTERGATYVHYCTMYYELMFRSHLEPFFLLNGHTH
jgi:hypothetical protein